MKVIILAGGYGTRLGNITESIPKPMVKIGNRPILWHIMKIYSNAGYNDFIISLGYKGEVIKEYFFNYSVYSNNFTINTKTGISNFEKNKTKEDWNITLVNTGLNTLKGARVKRLEKYLDDDINMITYGDGVADIDINEVVNFHKSHNKIVTITGVHPPSRFGEIVEKDNKLISFEEKPQTSGGLINGGFIIFNKELLGYLNNDEKCELESGPFEELAKNNQIMVYNLPGNWECIDTERDLSHMNKLWNQNKAFWKVW
jgi:glucose-1-phosphate cytidylyltransferase